MRDFENIDMLYRRSNRDFLVLPLIEILNALYSQLGESIFRYHLHLRFTLSLGHSSKNLNNHSIGVAFGSTQLIIIDFLLEEKIVK